MKLNSKVDKIADLLSGINSKFIGNKGWIVFETKSVLCCSKRAYHGQKFRFRPGLEDLRLLEAAGFKLGIWSSSKKSVIPYEKLKKLCKLENDWFCILSRAHCQKAPASMRTNSWDTVKPSAVMKTKFPSIPFNQVIFIDSSTNKYTGSTENVVCMPGWEGAEGDKCLPVLVQSLLETITPQASMANSSDRATYINEKLFQEQQRMGKNSFAKIAKQAIVDQEMEIAESDL